MKPDTLKLILLELARASAEFRDAQFAVANLEGLRGADNEAKRALARQRLSTARDRVIGAEAIALTFAIEVEA